ncbi:hypothetical protein [Lactobacillus amylovorus]|uniref:hypothetical protein n=1 Tax=Lactobacillus amylovorus TaxID=1604 RepID=UPI00200B16FF|nr:hypothetical protein [Lactobacillus amylovorus]
MIDIYNEKLAKYADGERRIFTATFLRPDDRKGIFQNLTVNNEDNVVVKQIVLRMNKAFKELNLEKATLFNLKQSLSKTIVVNTLLNVLLEWKELVLVKMRKTAVFTLSATIGIGLKSKRDN